MCEKGVNVGGGCCRGQAGGRDGSKGGRHSQMDRQQDGWRCRRNEEAVHDSTRRYRGCCIHTWASNGSMAGSAAARLENRGSTMMSKNCGTRHIRQYKQGEKEVGGSKQE